MESDSPAVEALRWQYAWALRRVPAEALVVVDETGCRTDMTRTHGRAPRGERLRGEAVPRNRGCVTTVIGALTLQGITAHLEVEGGTTLEVWGRFVLEHLVPVLEPGQVVVWDNLAVHHCRALIDVIEARGARVLFLPPYSPDFSPIEPAWSKLKALLRKWKLRTRQSLGWGLRLALAALTPRDAAGWFSHCGYPVAQPH
ncbi:IS630 family transposase [Corallococcus interemptor]|uniref:IS630 family transposase n=1 Tax=Corallococcus TaxID=83461 RepID=UPI001CBF7653|nr:IS630 family transposase [Corallococcus sp. AS-1-12]MBZ4371624.1 IS630 family transposase [Corallococcus sp. AS-1-6]